MGGDQAVISDSVNRLRSSTASSPMIDHPSSATFHLVPQCFVRQLYQSYCGLMSGLSGSGLCPAKPLLVKIAMKWSTLPVGPSISSLLMHQLGTIGPLAVTKWFRVGVVSAGLLVGRARKFGKVVNVIIATV